MQIRKANTIDISQLTSLAKETFIQSHGHSSPKEDLEAYIKLNFTETVFKKEIENPKNIYYLLYNEEKLIGYSKIVFNDPISPVSDQNITKLSRIYILEEAHGKGLGVAFLNYNLELAKAEKQAGMWLFVWVDNHRAISFYKKMGFEIVGSHDFEISKTHSNPNHQMYLGF